MVQLEISESSSLSGENPENTGVVYPETDSGMFRLTTKRKRGHIAGTTAVTFRRKLGIQVYQRKDVSNAESQSSVCGLLEGRSRSLLWKLELLSPAMRGRISGSEIIVK